MNSTLEDMIKMMEKNETQCNELREKENKESYEKIESLKEAKMQLKNQIKKHLTDEK